MNVDYNGNENNFYVFIINVVHDVIIDVPDHNNPDFIPP